jgi:glucan phosphoethanolaminetransferase (alkaline phosphatase superfamily)
MFNFSNQVQELRSAIIGLVMLLATTLLGIVWITIGVHAALLQWLGSIWAPIVLGALCFLPIIIFALIKTFSHASQMPSNATAFDALDPRVRSLSSVLSGLSQKSPFVVAVAAAVAGFLASRFPSLLLLFTQVLDAYLKDTNAKSESGAADQAAQPSSELHTNNH